VIDSVCVFARATGSPGERENASLREHEQEMIPGGRMQLRVKKNSAGVRQDRFWISSVCKQSLGVLYSEGMQDSEERGRL